MAWLNAIPEGRDEPRGALYQAKGITPPMVQLTKGQYLLDYMMEMGPITSNGFGLIPRPDGAILDFFRGVGISLLPWEFMTLRRLCRAYAAEYANAKDKFSISPMDRD